MPLISHLPSTLQGRKCCNPQFTHGETEAQGHRADQSGLQSPRWVLAAVSCELCGKLYNHTPCPPWRFGCCPAYKTPFCDSTSTQAPDRARTDAAVTQIQTGASVEAGP